MRPTAEIINLDRSTTFHRERVVHVAATYDPKIRISDVAPLRGRARETDGCWVAEPELFMVMVCNAWENGSENGYTPIL